MNARWSFIRRTKELEDKANLLTDSEQGSLWLLFCSPGSWNEKDLEDFADFYKSGIFRSDDPGQNAIKKYMLEKGIVFSRRINGFHYLERRHDEVSYRNFVIDIKGPVVP